MVLPPVHLDASDPWEKWAGLSHNSCDVIISINLLQYSSFKTAQVGLVAYKSTEEIEINPHSILFTYHFLRECSVEQDRSSNKTAFW